MVRYNLEIPLLDVFIQKKRNQYIEEIIWTNMLTSAFLAIVKVWNQPQCPLIYGERKCGIQPRREYASAIKGMEFCQLHQNVRNWRTVC